MNRFLKNKISFIKKYSKRMQLSTKIFIGFVLFILTITVSINLYLQPKHQNEKYIDKIPYTNTFSVGYIEDTVSEKIIKR